MNVGNEKLELAKNIAFKDLLNLVSEQEKELKKKDEAIFNLELTIKKFKQKKQVKSQKKGSITVNDFAHLLRKMGIDIGRKRFRWYLIKNKYMESDDVPTYLALMKDLLDYELIYAIRGSGRETEIIFPYVTPNGQKYFFEELSKTYGKLEQSQIRLKCL